MSSLIWGLVQTQLGEYFDFDASKGSGLRNILSSSPTLYLYDLTLKPAAIRKIFGIPYRFRGSVRYVKVTWEESWATPVLTLELHDVCVEVSPDVEEVAIRESRGLAEDRTIGVRQKVGGGRGVWLCLGWAFEIWSFSKMIPCPQFLKFMRVRLVSNSKK